MKYNRSIDMLRGPIVRGLILFALPHAASGILQQLFNAADVAVVGQFAGKNPMAAVGSTSPMIFLFVTLFTGLSLGANVVIAARSGVSDDEGARRAVHTAVVLALIGGVILALIGGFFAKPLLALQDLPPELLDLAALYFRIYMMGMPVILLYNFEAAIFSSQGDTRTPLLVLIASGVVNVLLNLFFVVVLHMTSDGVAIATVLSNAVGAALLFVLLCCRTDRIRLTPRALAIDRTSLAEILRIGVPAGLQSAVYCIANIMIQTSINRLGADTVAGSSAASNIEFLVVYLVSAFGQACMTFVSQNDSAGDLARCRRIVARSLLLVVAFAAASSGAILLAGRPLLAIFNTDPAVLAAGMIRFRFVVGFEILNGSCEVMSGALRGHKRSTVPAVISIAGICGVRLLWLYTVFARTQRFEMLMTAYPVSWVVTFSALLIAYAIYLKKRNDQTPEVATC